MIGENQINCNIFFQNFKCFATILEGSFYIGICKNHDVVQKYLYSGRNKHSIHATSIELSKQTIISVGELEVYLRTSFELFNMGGPCHGAFCTMGPNYF